MLVLSRREKEKVLFPSLGISIEVVKTKGSNVRLGITAPDNVPIRRAELEGLKSLEFNCDEENADERLNQLADVIQQRLQTASFGLNQLHQRIEEKDFGNLQSAIIDIYHELRSLEKEAKSVGGDSPAKRVTDARRALVVEDDINSSQLLASFLRLHGFEVTTAPDGQDALDYLSMHSPPDVVLLDMYMPRCDGPTLLHKLRANPANSKMHIFGMSGAEPATLGVPVGPTGVDRWFSKPLNPEQLVSEVQQELDPHHAA